MKRILKPTSRLIIVFVLTMIISGGILTYLSISSISNFRELTEKRVSEEQLDVSRNLSIEFQGYLADITSGKRETRARTLRQYPFTVDETGSFLRPWYLDKSTLKAGPDPSTAYGRYFGLAQQSEFRRKDYKSAGSLYQRSLSYASSSSDSARSLNALGRVYKRSGNLSGAHYIFSLIASDLSSIRDDNGFPFVYYSVLNLLEINNQQDTLQILPLIHAVLQKMLQSAVPINSSTTDVLTKITNWIEGSTSLNNREVLELEVLLNQIESYLDFIQRFGPGIREALTSWKKQEYEAKQGRFLVINQPSLDPGKIVLLDTTISELAGYSLDIDTLWSTFIQETPYHSEFSYTIKLVRDGSYESANEDELILSSEFSPFFSASRIVFNLKDKDLIHNFVKRRSWTYGIALFLLLGAMLLGIVLILRDINRESRLAHLRSDFVSNVSHELKTPLTSIHVFAESVLLDRVKSASDQKEYLRIILKETERLKRMINNILDFTKKEKGKSQYQSRPVDLTTLLKSAMEDLSYWLEEMNFRVLTDLQEGVLTQGDSEALKQVILNLLENAIKYSDKEREVGITLSKEEKLIRIKVSDKGIGIAEDQIGRIFEKFYRVNNAEVAGIGGTGLGLTVVKEIVEAHEGRIGVESTPGKGSIFTIELNSL